MNYELYLTATFIKHVNVLSQIIPYSYLILNPFNTGALLKVTLDGEAKLAQGSREGYYTLNSPPVNGKQNWIHIQGSNAIWYEKENNSWYIGDKKDLGTSTCGLHSTKNTKSPEEATTWKYFNKDNDEWRSTLNIFGSASMYIFTKYFLQVPNLA